MLPASPRRVHTLTVLRHGILRRVRCPEPGLRMRSSSILLSSPWDAIFVVTATIHAAALLSFPSIPLIAVGLWWTANTSAHNFIHRPFFSARAANVGFSLLLTAIMGIPQALWRDRHMAHHAARPSRVRATPQAAAETMLLGAVWGTIAAFDPGFFVTVYAPGWLCGLGLCALQGHYEHARGVTSHYGRLYNVLCFNDGYHGEHHTSPGVHWTRLRGRIAPGTRSSRWPALLRWLDAASLDTLERLVLRSRVLQHLVLRCHRRAFARLLPHLPPIRVIAIVGGGLFPRTALILRELLPTARIVIVDADRDNLESARALLDRCLDRCAARYVNFGLVGRRTAVLGARSAPKRHWQPAEGSAGISRQSPWLVGRSAQASIGRRAQALACAESRGLKTPCYDLLNNTIASDVEFEHRRYPAAGEVGARMNVRYDLLVIPLAFDGDREAIYRHPPATAVVIHDWIWRRRGTSRVISVALLKRLNLLTP